MSTNEPQPEMTEPSHLANLLASYIKHSSFQPVIGVRSPFAGMSYEQISTLVQKDLDEAIKSKHTDLLANEQKLVAALQVLLDQVDYTTGACRLNEMVGAVLDKGTIQMCRETIKEACKK